MSRDGSVELQWAGDVRRFRLGIDELLALQEKRDSGPFEIALRLRSNTWRLQDVQETIRLGLLGAEVEPKAAKELVETQVVPGKLMINAFVALAILLAALEGDGVEQPKKKPPAAASPGGSPPPPSTAPAL